MAKHICIFAGPGTGKSTTCAGLFYKMKSNGYKVEYCTEYAKNLVFSKDFYRLKDQLYVLAKQSHPWFKLDSQVDYTINDGPFLLGTIYLQESEHIPTGIRERKA
jgi:tRNA uridine 5-carbamoylmethylation protein Kti12